MSLRAIRAKCLDCVCFQPSEVRACEATDCPLHPYRMGTNPGRKKRVLTDEQKVGLAQRLADARAAKISHSDSKANESAPPDTGVGRFPL